MGGKFFIVKLYIRRFPIYFFITLNFVNFFYQYKMNSNHFITFATNVHLNKLQIAFLVTSRCYKDLLSFPECS